MKQCPKCRYFGNENDAHYCVKCGASLTPGEEWKVYNSYKVFEDGGLRLYFHDRDLLQEKEKEVKSLKEEVARLRSSLSSSESTVRRLRSELAPYRNKKSLWKRIDKYLDEHEWAAISLGMVVLAFIIIPLIFALDAACSSDNPKEISVERFEVLGKWGLKDKDGNILLNAVYDNIIPSSNPRYWNLYNGSKWGFAYRSDSNVVVTEPVYTNTRIGTGDYAAYQLDYKKWQMLRKGYNYGTRQDDIFFLKGGNYVSGRKGDTEGFKITNESSGKVIASGYTWARGANDSTIVASFDKNENIRFLADQTGKKVSETFVNPFPNWDGQFMRNGFQWVALNEKNDKEGIYTLMDDRGQRIFTTPANSAVKTTTKDRALYHPNSGSTWIAVDRQGKEVFKFTCANLDFFGNTIELARFRRNNKYGFIDKNGKIIIPAEYSSTSMYFDRDSTMRATKNGKRGTLKMDGTFTPDKK